MKYRTMYEIIADIMTGCAFHPRSFTAVQRICNLSTSQAKRYIAKCLANDLLLKEEVHDRGKVSVYYTTTLQGRHFRKLADKLQGLLEGGEKDSISNG